MFIVNFYYVKAPNPTDPTKYRVFQPSHLGA